MQELITAQQADLAFTVLAVIGLVVGGVMAVLAKRNGGNGVASGLLYGGPLVLIGAFWRVYGAISERLGAGSVRNLLVNLVLFLVIGGIVGAIWGRVVPVATKTEGAETNSNADTASV